MDWPSGLDCEIKRSETLINFKGKEGVKHVIHLLRTEFDYAMRLSGKLCNFLK